MLSGIIPESCPSWRGTRTHLMVIGYSFNDDHINDAILATARGGQLKMFIIDPLGIDVLDKNRGNAIYSPDLLISELGTHVIGASRRTLREIFGTDHVEHAKVIRFLPNQPRGR
jgi:hypothetical protein